MSRHPVTPVTWSGIYVNHGMPIADTTLWHWFYDMSLIETMEIVCSDYIRVRPDSRFNKLTILGIEEDGQIFPITYHEAKL